MGNVHSALLQTLRLILISSGFLSQALRSLGFNVVVG